jgi:hypothetical protein
MMPELIPLLRDLCFRRNGYSVPGGFARSFVDLHAEDWQLAQSHWERIVARVLNTDAVSRTAQGGEALRQAVAASAVLLYGSELRHRCPLCKRDRRTEDQK